LSTVDKAMVRGYCTLFPINNGQWSGGGLPIDRSPWNTDQGSMMGWESRGLIFLFGNVFVNNVKY